MKDLELIKIQIQRLQEYAQNCSSNQLGEGLYDFDGNRLLDEIDQLIKFVRDSKWQ